MKFVTSIFFGYLRMTFNRQTVNGHLFIRQVLYTSRYDTTYANITKRGALLPLTRGIGFRFYEFGP